MMAAEVSRQLKSSTPTTSNDGKRGHGGGPITRDFLGGDFGIESKELDLDLHVPAGWEKRLDLKSGNVYIQRCNPIISHKKTTTTSTRTPPHINSSNLQDLNFPPHTKPSGNSYSTGSTTLSLFEDTTLDLKLIPNSSSSTTTTTTHNSPIGGTSSPMMISNYQSVCTLDKVKSALDRAWRDPPSQPTAAKKRSSPSSLSGSSSMNQHYRAGSSSPSSMAVDGGGSSSHNNTNNNIHHQHLQLESSSSYNNSSSSSSTTTGLMVAAACPSCLLYVLVSKNNPRCPKCSSIITFPVMPKKPKIDLNISI